jgi:hypothetical protein
MALAACSGGDGGTPASEEVTSTTTTEVLRAGPLADRVADVLAFVNDGAGQVAELFAPSFLAAVPEAQLRQVVETQVRPGGPYEVATVHSQTDVSAVLTVRGAAAQTMTISIEADPPHRVVGLLFQPAPVELESWDDLDRRLRAAAPDVALLAAEVVDGRCVSVHAIDADRVLPLGSAFKLYVLGTLARSIDAGTARWDDEVEIRDELRVHSSQTYGATPAGTKVRIEDLAAAMISVSDNTATDLVMTYVGREAIESSLAALGMHDPSPNVPFLTTRELSLLKWGVPVEERAAYVRAGTSERRRRLEALPAHGATQDELTGSLDVPADVRHLEWFASPADLCRVHVALRDLATKPGLQPVSRILSVNRGVAFDDGWTRVAFKGGSEPGVLAGSWLAERRAGRTFFVAALLENEAGSIETAALGDVGGAFGLLAKVR